MELKKGINLLYDYHALISAPTGDFNTSEKAIPHVAQCRQQS